MPLLDVMPKWVQTEHSNIGVLLQILRGVKPRVRVAAFRNAGRQIVRQRVKAAFTDIGILFQIEAAVEMRVRISALVSATPQIMNQRIDA